MRELKAFYSNLFNISGRTRRREYFVGVLLTEAFMYILVALGFLSLSINMILGAIVMCVSCIFSIVAGIGCMTCMIRRMHDIGKSGWIILLQAIPCLGIILMLVFCLMDSEEEENQWGPNPKAEENDEYDSGVGVTAAVTITIFLLSCALFYFATFYFIKTGVDSGLIKGEYNYNYDVGGDKYSKSVESDGKGNITTKENGEEVYGNFNSKEEEVEEVDRNEDYNELDSNYDNSESNNMNNESESNDIFNSMFDDSSDDNSDSNSDNYSYDYSDDYSDDYSEDYGTVTDDYTYDESNVEKNRTNESIAYQIFGKYTITKEDFVDRYGNLYSDAVIADSIDTYERFSPKELVDYCARNYAAMSESNWVGVYLALDEGIITENELIRSGVPEEYVY